MAFAEQSNKHMTQIKRMQAQVDQAYDTVRVSIISPRIRIERKLTSLQLKDLLNLKQQQANVLEARVSRNEAISSGEQSKTIMVFTIVTIVFVRLSRHRLYMETSTPTSPII
jgi:hypothetical protein